MSHLPIEPPAPKTAEVAEISGWGRYPSGPGRVARPEKRRALRPVGAASLARGRGKSYGDAATVAGGVAVLTERLDRLLGFDPETGLLTGEAGATLDDLLAALLPRGWFPPVTPGTRFCSLGGCLAADVHGKNHHREGTFGAHIAAFELVMADGGTAYCTPTENPGLFWGTVGGMGLTGFVSTVTLRMKKVESSWMKVRHTPAKSLDELVALLADPGMDDEYTVAWIDCAATGSSLGRGVLMAGRHAAAHEAPRGKPALDWSPKKSKAVPFDFPSFALHPLCVRAFNSLYFWAQGRRGEFVCPVEPFFYPLDALSGWNRLYGKRGFVQYQYAVPTEGALEVTRAVLAELAREGLGSPLGVLKRFGPAGEGMLSFPLEGLTLALDIPVRPGLWAVLDRLDARVADAGGRVYLAKDARLSRESFDRMYPRAAEFRMLKEAVDPQGRIASDLGRRLGLCP